MKTIKKILILAMLIIGLNPLYAGGGHSHAPAVSVATIKTVAKDEVIRLAQAVKIDKSWAKEDISKIEKYNHGHEWRVIFKNKQIKDMQKQTLYIFVNTSGKITGANYTGK